MSVQYCYAPGDRVRHKYEGWEGVVKTCVPGNGVLLWYYVESDEGVEDRYTENDLEPIS